MGNTVLRVPLVIWAVLCLVISGIWLVVWPRDRLMETAGVRFFVLRWFHSLVWLLLAVAALLAAANVFGGVPTAKVLALLSLLIYLAFMAAVLSTKRPD